MWMCDDGSRLAVSDMDNRRACLGYDTDVCDPLGSVLGSGRVPARVLRRRCRSEGVDRSPYEDANRQLHSAESNIRNNRSLSNKSYFTLNSIDRFHHECILPAAENGDYLMAHEHKHHGFLSSRTKFHSPSRPFLTYGNVDESRLPKVEELFEKTDHDMHEMMEVAIAKEPLKPILNNPVQKSPPPSILKKPKQKQQYIDNKYVDGRRRQRASSESDYGYCAYHMVSPSKAIESRITYLQNSNSKRAKDNSGSGYSYGAAIASLPNTSITKHVTHHHRSQKLKEHNVVVAPKDIPQEMHILRTTAIDNCHEDPVTDVSRQDSQVPTCPAISPALPVSSVTNVPPAAPVAPPAPPAPVAPAASVIPAVPAAPVVKKIKTLKKKVKPKPKSMVQAKEGKTCIRESEPEFIGYKHSSPGLSMERIRAWQMDTDIVVDNVSTRTIVEEVKDEHPELFSTTRLQVNVNVSTPTIKTLSRDTPLNLPESMSTCLRTSLFPRVPPYLRFIGHDEAPSLKVPLAIQKHLKWKLTTITPIVVKKTLTNSGFRLVKSECDTAECPQDETVEWIGIWGKHMKSLMFRAIKDGQKMNHFPGTFQIGRKDRLWRNLQKLCAKFGSKEFGIMPKTYVLPHDLKLLKHDWDKHFENNERWIIKPPASARGTGIKVVSKWTQIPKKRPVVVQKYVSKPYLINGNKFDMRLYVLVTSIHPLRIYLYKDGLARFASVKYNDEVGSLNDRYMHLTNYSINRLSKNYTPNEDFAACEGHKWTLQTLFQYLRTEKKIDTVTLWESLKDLVIKTIISGEGSISSLTKANVTSRYNCYELFGIDVLLDENLKPWLLEVNISPSLHSASPLDIHVKGPLVTTVLNIAQFQVPVRTNLENLCKDKPNRYAGLPYDSRLYTVYLSKEERDKHIIYTNMEERDMYLRDILSTLTPDDVRHLIQAEDELSQSGDMERIFPNKNSYKYLAYLTGPRYYNRLFDAWESRYSDCRCSGLDLLKNLCDIGYHLEVPPVPLKNDVDAPSPVASEPSVASVEQRPSAPRLFQGEGPAAPAQAAPATPLAAPAAAAARA